MEEVLGENAVSGEKAEDALEVLGITGGEDTCEDLGGGEGSIGAAFPDGIRNVEAYDSVEAHRDADHVCHLHYS